MITSESPVDIWCLGTLEAKIYVLHKEGSQKPWGTQTPEKPESKAKFSIPSVTHLDAGQYRCYCYSSAGWSERSDTLELVVKGEGRVRVSAPVSALRSIPFPQPSPEGHCGCVSPCNSLPPSVLGIHNSKPRLSALPSPVVTSGGNMTLQCVSWERYDKFILTKEDQKFLSSTDSQDIHSTRQYQALFSIDHVTPDHKGIIRCYGYYNHAPQLWSVPSDPLEIHISGESLPSLTNHF